MGDLFVRCADRRTLRRATRIPCRVRCERTHVDLPGVIVDLSLDGGLVRCDLAELYAVNKSPLVSLSFRITDVGVLVRANGKIARVVQGRRDTDAGYALGVEFTDLKAVSRMILGGALRKRAPVVPARERRIDYAATIRAIAES